MTEKPYTEPQERVLQALRELNAARPGRIWVTREIADVAGLHELATRTILESLLKRGAVSEHEVTR